MYSLTLMLAMASADTAPQGILFNRGNCNGGLFAAQPVRAVVNATAGRVRLVVANQLARTPVRNLLAAAPVRSAVANVVANRPQVLARVARVAFTGRTQAACGCSGVSVSASVTVTPNVAAPMPTTGTPSVAAPPVGGLFRDRDRVAIQLKRALRRSDSPLAKKALADDDVFAALVAKVHKDLDRQAKAVGGTVGKLGDGTLFDKFIAALPTILDAIERILKILG